MRLLVVRYDSLLRRHSTSVQSPLVTVPRVEDSQAALSAPYQQSVLYRGEVESLVEIPPVLSLLPPAALVAPPPKQNRGIADAWRLRFPHGSPVLRAGVGFHGHATPDEFSDVENFGPTLRIDASWVFPVTGDETHGHGIAIGFYLFHDLSGARRWTVTTGTAGDERLAGEPEDLALGQE